MEAVRSTLRYLITNPFIKSRIALIMRLLRKDCSLSFRSYAHTHTRALQRDNNKWSRESSTNALLFEISLFPQVKMSLILPFMLIYLPRSSLNTSWYHLKRGVKWTKRFVWQTWPCWETNSCVKVNSSPLLPVHSRISRTCVPSFTLYINRNTIMSIWMPKGLNAIQRLI